MLKKGGGRQMPMAPEPDRAVRYACAVCADLQISRLPVDPFLLASSAGIPVVPLSSVLKEPGWFPPDLPARMQMNSILTLTYPAFCVVFRDDAAGTDRLRFMLCHELGHLFMNHYREDPDLLNGRPHDPVLETEADRFARNLLAPVPIVDVIRYNRPRQARAALFGMTRAAWIARLDSLPEDRAFVDEDMANTLIWLFHDYLLGRRCTACGHVFKDRKQQNRCPKCGASDPDWDL